MGSKNLKAIAVRGGKDIAVPDMPSFLEGLREIIKESVLIPDNDFLPLEGTWPYGEWMQEGGIVPTRNFQTGISPTYEKFRSELRDKFKKGNKACIACPLD